MNKYECGFVVRGEHRIEMVEWLLSKTHSNDSRLVFQAYDANLYPLPDLGEWKSQSWINKQIEKGLMVSSEFSGEVWLDDIQIK